MRVRVPSLVISFPTTSDATACEKLCREKGLPGRIIPLPSSISAGCGLAWKTYVDMGKQMTVELDAAGVAWDQMKVCTLWELVKSE